MGYNLNITKSVKPDSSFVDSITLDGNIASIKFKNNKNVYHYQVDAEIKNMISRVGSPNALTAGQIFNRHIKNKIVAKTVYF